MTDQRCNSASPADGSPTLGLEQLSRALARVRKETFDRNGQNYLDLSIDLLGSGNTALIHKVIGTDMADLRPWVGSDGFEHFRPGFEPKYKGRLGLPIVVVQWYNLLCELGAGRLPKDREVEAVVKGVGAGMVGAAQLGEKEVGAQVGGGDESASPADGHEGGYVVDDE